MRFVALLFASTILLAGCTPDSKRGSFTDEQLEIAELESLLRGWKYLSKRINGQMDAEDKAALDLFRKDWKIPTSEPRETVLAYLKRQHPETTAKDQFPVANSNCTTSNPFPQPGETVTWTGGCQNGELQGTGTLTWRFLRRGEWAEQTSEGTLVNGLLNGFGRTVSPGEYVYEGEYKDHTFHGKGSVVRTTGWKYDGLWENGQPNGQGTVTSPSGEEFSGVFKQGCLPGPTGGYIAFNTSKAQCARNARKAS